MPNSAHRAWLFALLLLCAGFAAALPAQGQGQPLTTTQVEALQTLAGKITALEQELDALTDEDAARRSLLEQELRELRWQFGGLAARFDVQDFEAPRASKFDLRAELEDLVRPLIQSLKDATAEPRQIAGLKERIAALSERQSLAETAQREAEATERQLPEGSPERAVAHWEVHERWGKTIRGLRDERTFLQAQLDGKQANQKPTLQAIRDGAQEFISTSGLNLLLAAIVFCAVFFGLRWIQGRLLRRRVAGRATSLRVLEVALATLGLVLAIAATIVVPYVRNDWLLLAVCIVFLLGVGWVLVKMLPQFVEQIRLVLNIGPVREGERLVVDGLPYRIDTIRFYSRLSNPELQGGELRVPILDLIDRRSRPCGEGEPWFPSRKGDYVRLDDGVYGQVLTQTPATVIVNDVAAPKYYPTAAFLDLNPRNLSRGFGIRSTFGVDYRHQPEATTTIPETLTAALRAGLERMVQASQIRRVQVEFQAAGSSSLDLNARADFAGEAAPLWRELDRAVQRLLVDACTENGWTIPFPQLTVHTMPAAAGSGQ